MTEYSDETNERADAIMADYDECMEKLHAEHCGIDGPHVHSHPDADLMQQRLDLLAETWHALVEAGITRRDADRVLGVFAF